MRIDNQFSSPGSCCSIDNVADRIPAGGQTYRYIGLVTFVLAPILYVQCYTNSTTTHYYLTTNAEKFRYDDYLSDLRIYFIFIC